MAYPSIISAVSKIVMDAKLQVVDDLLTFLADKVELDEDTKSIFENFKQTLKADVKVTTKKGKKSSDDGEDKKKREPSIFNLFVKDKMPELKANHDAKDGKSLITLASEAWKTDEFAQYLKEKVVELKKEDASASNSDLYNKAKAMYDDDKPSSSKAPASKPKADKQEKAKPAQKKKAAAKGKASKKSDSDNESSKEDSDNEPLNSDSD